MAFNTKRPIDEILQPAQVGLVWYRLNAYSLLDFLNINKITAFSFLYLDDSAFVSQLDEKLHLIPEQVGVLGAHF